MTNIRRSQFWLSLVARNIPYHNHSCRMKLYFYEIIYFYYNYLLKFYSPTTVTIYPLTSVVIRRVDPPDTPVLGRPHSPQLETGPW